MLSPRGFAPPVPGVTNTSGMASANADPLAQAAMMMGQRQPGGPDSIGDKMAQVIQLLREVTQSDPRLSQVVGPALQMLVEGPSLSPTGAAGQGASVPPNPGIPVGGPV